MLSFPNAKINIGLYITSKRPDGFHNLESCFYPIPWAEGVEVIQAAETRFTSTGLPVPGAPESNLCLKAYRLMEQRFNLPAVAVHLHKVLPMGAGLGGGSADAAHVIKLLNLKFELALPKPELEKLARELGSDCAFFIGNTPVFATEKGDRFEPLALDLKGYYLAVVYPGIHISTAEAYSRIKPKPAPHDLRKVLSQSAITWKELVNNDFEEALFPHYPTLPELKKTLYAQGAVYASMSGSGSAVYGIFAEETNLKPHLPGEYLVWQGLL